MGDGLFGDFREFFRELCGIDPPEGGWQKNSDCKAEYDDDDEPIYDGENLLLYWDDRWMDKDKDLLLYWDDRLMNKDKGDMK